MRRLRFALTAALALTACLALAACGSDDPVDVSGSGYTYTAPGGWEDVTGDADAIADSLGAEITAEDVGATYDSVVVSDSETDDFATNMNVVSQDGLPDALTAEDVANQSAEALGNPEQAARFLPEGAEISVEGTPRKSKLDGEDAYEFTYDATFGGSDLRAKQIYVVLDGTGYVVTFTAADAAYDDDLADFEEITESWKFD